MKQVNFEFSILSVKKISLKDISSVDLFYSINGWSKFFKKEMLYGKEENGNLIYNISIEVEEKDFVDYYFVINLKDGSKDVTDNEEHFYSIDFHKFLNFLTGKYNNREKVISKEDDNYYSDNPEVSVIIPSYNSEQHVFQAIESVYNQNYTDFEIIFIDDNSTDNTCEVISPYMKLKNFKYYKMDKNYGVAYARNFAIKKASGKYIAQLDADDLYLPDFLNESLRVLKANKSLEFVTSLRYDNIPDKNHFMANNSIMCPYCSKVDENDNSIPSPEGRGHVFSNMYCEKCYGYAGIYFYKSDVKFLNELITQNCFITHGATLFKKESFIRNEGYDIDLKITSDWDFWLRSFTVNNWQLIKKPLYVKKIHDDNIWAKVRKVNDVNLPKYYRSIVKNKFKYVDSVKKNRKKGIKNKKNFDEFFKNKSVVIYPFNKETNSLIRYRDKLNFNISAVIDYTYQDEKDLGEILYKKDIGIPLICTESKALDAIKNCDLFVTLETPEPKSPILNYYSPEQANRFWYNLFETALYNKKDIYSCSYTMENEISSIFYRDYIKKNNIKIYYPEITMDDYFNNFEFAQKYEFNFEQIKTNFIGVFGTGPCQGKFTTQLHLKYGLTGKGFNVKHLSTEPFGELFGSTITCNERIDDYHHKKWYRGNLYKMLKENPDFIITGGQGTIFNEPSKKVLEFIFPKKFDNILLSVRMDDSDEIISGHIEEIKYSQGRLPAAFILSSAQETQYQDYIIYSLDDLKARKKYLSEKFDLPAYELVLLDESEGLIDLLLSKKLIKI